MNYETTKELIEAITPYIASDNITISNENMDWKGKPYKSDLVMVDKKNRIGFEVFNNEIIVFYFTDHDHFEDYTSNSQSDEDNYIKRAIEFLIELFTFPIRHIEKYKGKKLISEKYYFVYSDGREERFIGGTWHGFVRLFNPFGKKISKSTTYQYDKSKGMFTNSQPRNYDPNAIEVIPVNDLCYIEIFEKDGAFFFVIQKLYFDDYSGMSYWTPFDDGTLSLFDSKEKAIAAAKRNIKTILDI